MNSRKQGDVGTSFAIAYFSSSGFTVNVPLSDSQSYDLIIEKDGTCQKVQVKTSFKPTKYDKYRLELRTISNTRGKKLEIRKISAKDFDLLFAMDGLGRFFVVPSTRLDGFAGIALSKLNEFEVLMPKKFGK